MNKIIIGLLFGSIAGIIDVIPMIIQKLTLDANISAIKAKIIWYENILFLLNLTHI